MTDQAAATPTLSGLSVSIMGGRLTHLKRIALPFQEDLIHDLQRVGFRNEDTATVEAAFPRLPPFPPNRGPTASITAEQVLVGFGVYLSVRLADGVIGALATDLYGKVVKVAFSRLRVRVNQSEKPPPVHAVFDHWFDHPGVLVRVVVHDAAGTSPHEHVPVALWQALAWLAAHGVTHRVLTFQVRDGRLDLAPELAVPVTGPEDYH